MSTALAPTAGIEPVSRARRLATPLATAAFCAAGAAALYLRDPHVHGSWGFCPLFALTGAYCPGCGGLRAVNDLAHGDLLAAASSNLLFVAALPLVAFFWTQQVVRAWRGDPARERGRAWNIGFTLCLVAAAVFTVLRNTGVPWLAP